MGCLFRLGWATFLVIVALALFKHFAVDVMPVTGLSMFPTFHHRDVIVLNKISYLTGRPARGDSVVLRFPGDPDRQRYIKRIVGLPGETVTITSGQVLINQTRLTEPYLDPSIATLPDSETTLGVDDYFLLGDNRPVSSDSRVWGPAKRTDLIGKVFAIIWPRQDATTVPLPAY